MDKTLEMRSNSQNEIPLKIGFLLDSKITDKYVHDLIDWAFKRDKIIVSNFIIQEIKSENYLKRLNHIKNV